jgi:uncharacterized OB-fold protein
MSDLEPLEGVVYTETVIHAAPEQYAADAPYQIAIVDFAGGPRQTVRMDSVGERVAVGDRVVMVRKQGGVLYCRKIV